AHFAVRHVLDHALGAAQRIEGPIHTRTQNGHQATVTELEATLVLGDHDALQTEHGLFPHCRLTISAPTQRHTAGTPSRISRATPRPRAGAAAAPDRPLRYRHRIATRKARNAPCRAVQPMYPADGRTGVSPMG